MKKFNMNRGTFLMFLVGISLGVLIINFTSISKASGSEMTVCVKKDGVMHLIGDNFKRSDCKRNEKLLTFNTQGQVGNTGPQGDAGAVGPQGPQGDIGPTGLQGIAGVNGTTIPCVHVDGNDVYFDGCNIHIRNGSNSTFTNNGLGNLILGYNEDTGGPFNRTGSHNLIIGPYHTYSSFGGIVAGQRNTISAGSASVLGGVDNIAGGTQSVISGGSGNNSGGINSSVSGGTMNTASGDNSSVSGGKYNGASANSSSISGGDHNTTTAISSSVSGGHERSATGIWNWVAGSLFQAN